MGVQGGVPATSRSRPGPRAQRAVGVGFLGLVGFFGFSWRSGGVVLGRALGVRGCVCVSVGGGALLPGPEPGASGFTRPGPRTEGFWGAIAVGWSFDSPRYPHLPSNKKNTHTHTRTRIRCKGYHAASVAPFDQPSLAGGGAVALVELPTQPVGPLSSSSPPPLRQSASRAPLQACTFFWEKCTCFYGLPIARPPARLPAGWRFCGNISSARSVAT